jgi:hypothetical protein
LCSAEFSRRSPLARLAGVAPIDASSGQQRRHRLNPHAEALRRADRRQTLPPARYRNARDASACGGTQQTPGPDELRASASTRFCSAPHSHSSTSSTVGVRSVHRAQRSRAPRMSRVIGLRRKH